MEKCNFLRSGEHGSRGLSEGSWRAMGVRQGAQGHHGRQSRLCAMVRGPALRGCAKNCAPRGDFIRILAPSGHEERTFEVPHGARFAWKLVGLPAG